MKFTLLHLTKGFTMKKKGESSFLSITILKAAAYLEYNQLQIT